MAQKKITIDQISNSVLTADDLLAGASIGDSDYNLGSIELNVDGSGNRNAFIDFWSHDAASDYDARIIRAPGVNGAFSINNKGTGNISIQQTNTGDILIQTNGGDIKFRSTGLVYLNDFTSGGITADTNRIENVGAPSADTDAATKGWVENTSLLSRIGAFVVFNSGGGVLNGYNVSSVTRTAAGKYTVNFTTALGFSSKTVLITSSGPVNVAEYVVGKVATTGSTNITIEVTVNGVYTDRQTGVLVLV